MDRIDRLKEFIEKFPNDMFSRHALAMEYLKLGNEEAAEEVMRELLQHELGYQRGPQSARNVLDLQAREHTFRHHPFLIECDIAFHR